MRGGVGFSKADEAAGYLAQAEQHLWDAHDLQQYIL